LIEAVIQLIIINQRNIEAGVY